MGIGCRPIGKFKSEMVKIENKIAKEKAAHVVKKNNKMKKTGVIQFNKDKGNGSFFARHWREYV